MVNRAKRMGREMSLPHRIQILSVFNTTAADSNQATVKQSLVHTPGRGQTHKYFVVEQSVVAVLYIISLYLSVVSVVYVLKHGRKNLRVANVICCASAVLLFFECCLFEVEEFLPRVSDAFCTAYLVFNALVAVGNRTMIYGVLWMRQRRLYTNKLKKITSCTIQVISISTIIGIVFFALLNVVALSLMPQVEEDNSCVSGKLTKVTKILLPLSFTVSSLFQIVLLGLTIYPVVRHQCGKGRVSALNAKLKKLLTRLTLCTSVCLLADFSFMAILRNKPKDAEYGFIPMCSAFNTGLHIISMMFSFSDYRFRLWPFQKVSVKKSGQGAVVQAPRSDVSSSSRKVMMV